MGDFFRNQVKVQRYNYVLFVYIALKQIVPKNPTFPMLNKFGVRLMIILQQHEFCIHTRINQTNSLW